MILGNYAVVVTAFLIAFLRANVNARFCGVESCHKTDPNKLNVHIFSHTHDDVGWLKTVDQYYYGSNNQHAPFGVQYIIDSVVSELHKDKNRRFSYVESAFFWRWWTEQNEDSRKVVQQLVEEGRLEFLHGGWCMSDEATPHYSAMIDQMTLGLKFLNETFGECGRPLVAWQIDPFGHSGEVALQFAQMGFDGVIVARIDHEDHRNRVKKRALETVWRPDTSEGIEGELFFGTMYNEYTSPAGFCFDVYCNNEPIMDNPKLHGYNVKTKVESFISIIRTYAAAYQTNHVMMPMGGDFTYTAASPWFKNIDKLIKYIPTFDPSINVIYSTPSCYLRAIQATNATWPVTDDDDFFPYGSDEHSYWTGYYTSRPNFKNMVYRANNLLQAIKQLSTTLPGDDLKEEEEQLKQALAISQHHDSVSGTEKQHVTDDYALYLHEGIHASRFILNKVYKNLLGAEYPEQHYCNMRNVSECRITTEKDGNFVVTIYNPLSHMLSTPVFVPVQADNDFKIFQSDGSEVPFDLVPIASPVYRIPGRTGNATHNLIFVASQLPPHGAVHFYVEVLSSGPPPIATFIGKEELGSIVVGKGAIQLSFNSTTGLLESITKDGETWPFQQNFYFYEGMKGYNYNADSRASGAYIFRPTKTEPKPIAETANVTIFNGTGVIEIHQVFTPWLSQIVRLYEIEPDIEFEWLVGPIPVQDWVGKEIVSRYTTSLATASDFYTDSNGRRWMKRTRNHRKTWNFVNITEPIASNYYPMTTAACLRDGKKQLTVVADRPQGATSMRDGQLEIMIHRRLLYDDGKGVSEPLDETAFGEGLVARGKHIIQLNTIGEAAKAHRLATLRTVYAPLLSFAKVSLSPTDWLSKFKVKFQLLRNELPKNVHILTVERWGKNQILLRLEHIFHVDEDAELSKPSNFDLKNIFTSFEVKRAEEVKLAANQAINTERLKWRHDGPKMSFKSQDDLLNPMQIRTFILHV